MPSDPPQSDRSLVDTPTLIAIAVVVYAFSNFFHEGFGHAGTCLSFAGKLIGLNAIYVDCDLKAAGRFAEQIEEAAGTLMNLVVALFAWLAWRWKAVQRPSTRFGVWLLMVVSLLQGTGYWLFSGVGNLGDWAQIIEGSPRIGLWRAVLALLGAAGYAGAITVIMKTIGVFVGSSDGYKARARKLMLVPYFSGGVLLVIAGLFNPVSPAVVIVSAAAASFGGTSALAWTHTMLRRPADSPTGSPAFSIPRSVPWIVGGVATAAVFVGVLGRTVAP